MKFQGGYLTKQSGAWLGHYSQWVTDHATGKRKRRQRAWKIGRVSDLTKTQAKAKLQERVATDVGITADSRASFKWFTENRWKPLYEGTWRDSTKDVNAELLKVVTDRFGDTPLEDMDAVAMQVWLTDLAKKKSGSLVRHSRIFLRSIMAEAYEQDYCRKNTARLLRVPKLKPVRKDYLTLEQIKALLKAAMWYPRDRTLLRLILVTALRPSELLALKWKCFDFKDATMTLHETVYRGKVRPYTKTTEEGELPRLMLPDAAVEALADWHTLAERTGDEDYVFPNADGGFLLKSNYSNRVLNMLAEDAEIPRVNFQILRRTVATHAQHLGSPKDIATLMRHKKVETSQQIYIQTIDATVREMGKQLAAKMLPKKKK